MSGREFCANLKRSRVEKYCGSQGPADDERMQEQYKKEAMSEERRYEIDGKTTRNSDKRNETTQPKNDCLCLGLRGLGVSGPASRNQHRACQRPVPSQSVVGRRQDADGLLAVAPGGGLDRRFVVWATGGGFFSAGATVRPV